MRRLAVVASGLLVTTWAATSTAQIAPPTPAPAAPPAASAPALPAAPPPAPSPEVDAEKKNQARAAFESGIAHFDRGEWSAALADFLRSRELFPTKSATKNAGVCFRREGRLDEELESFETLLREFADLAPADRAFAEKEIADLRALVGSLEISGSEPGAAIVVDGRARGNYPTPAPVRLGAGSHVVRVYKEGFVPFERRIDVGGRQLVSVEARLPPLTSSGRLTVTEAGSRSLDVVVDNVVVGKTPWQGTVPVGSHSVVLRGDDDLGTQPSSALVRNGEITSLSLAAEELTSTLRVTPEPNGATVSIDGVVVGQGVWEGKLREGSHRIEVAAESFLVGQRSVALPKAGREAVTVVLERDPTSPLWRTKRPPRVFAEADVGPAIGLSYGGDVRATCDGSCSGSIPFGYALTVHGGYELSSGLALGLDAGWLFVGARTERRATSVFPRGLAPNSGTADDDLGLYGFRFGPSGAFRFGDDWPVTLRLGAGLFFGSAVDVRRGSFTNAGGERYDLRASESHGASYVYIAPEVRVSRRFASRLELGVGLTVLALVALDRPSWQNEDPLVAAPPGRQGDGAATFGTQSLVGGFVAAVVPNVGLRYAF